VIVVDGWEDGMMLREPSPIEERERRNFRLCSLDVSVKGIVE